MFEQLPATIPPQPSGLIGRSEEREKLLTQLLEADLPLFVLLTGPAGSGKTALASDLAHDPAVRQRFPDGLLWATMGPQPELTLILNQWATALNTTVHQLKEETARVWAIKRAIGRRRILLVIDDAHLLKTALLLRCGGINCGYLLTTRFSSVAEGFGKDSQPHVVAPLGEATAVRWLQQQAPAAWQVAPETVTALAQQTAGHPLTLRLLSPYLQTTATQPANWASLIERLAATENLTQRLQLLLANTLAHLPTETAQAWRALHAFAPEPATLSEEAALAVSDSSATAVGQLAQHHLLTERGEQWMIPAALANLADESPPEEAVARHVTFYLAAAQARREDWTAVAPLYPQLRQAWPHINDDRQLLDFTYAARPFQRQQGLWSDYIDWHMHGIKIAKALNWSADLGTLRNNLGAVYELLGQGQKAIEFYQRALEVREQEDEVTGLMTTLSNMGSIYYRSGLQEQALATFQRLLRLHEKEGTTLDKARVLSNIGSVYERQGQIEEALNYYQQALASQKEAEDRVGQAVSLNNLGSAYDKLARFDEALTYYQQALAIREEVADHSGRATTLNNIGTAYQKLERPAKALSYFQQALEIQQRIADRQGEIITRWWLALTYQELERLSEAAEQLQAAVDVATEARSPYLTPMKKLLSEIEHGLS